MRYAVLLGIILVALPLFLRAPSADPWPDVSSYETVGLLEHPQWPAPSIGHSIARTLFSLAPPAAILILLATVSLFAASALRPSEPFVIILAASPAFLITFTQLGITPITVTVTLIAAALLAHKQVWALACIPLCVALDAASGVLATVVLIAIAVRQGRHFVALAASAIAIVSCMLALALDPGFGLVTLTPFAFIHAEALGIAGGATVLTLFLATIGFVLAYRASKERSLLLLLLLVPLVMILEHGAVIATTLLAFYAANAWEYLANRQWSFAELRDITLIILVCSLLFTASVTVRERASPDAERIEFMRFSTNGFPAGSTVLADEDSRGILRREGIATATAELPSDRSFIASKLREQGIEFIVTRDKNPPYAHFAKSYASSNPGGYTVYTVPSE